MLPDGFADAGWQQCGLTVDLLAAGARSAYSTLDTIDGKLLESDLPRLSGLVELANLSSMIGNLLAAGIVKASNGLFNRAGPHKYQDLRASLPGSPHIEIKMALEGNTPKGHLPKEGYYLTCRYVLGNIDKSYKRRERGDIVWIWELRFGYLEPHHFTVSNTEGDSGKTAVVNSAGMAHLQRVYFDRALCPIGPKSKYWQAHD